MKSTSAMVASENSLQLVNFGVENGWNEIEANLLGVTGIFSGNTPLSTIRASIDTYAQAFQQKPDKIEVEQHGEQNPQQLPNTVPSSTKKICSDKNGKVVPCGSATDAGEKKTIFGQIIEGLYRIGKSIGDATGNTVDPNYSKTTGNSKLAGDFSIDDIFKRGMLLLIAIAVLLVALYVITK